MTSRSIPALGLAAALVFVVACTDGVAESVGGGRGPAGRAASRFDEDACRFEVPGAYEVRCGWLVVPEVRDRPEAGEVRLHVGVFRRDGADLRADPLVYLEGGPGGNALAGAVADFDGRFGLFAEDREVVVFDQRGTGYSEPSLDCPELRQLWLDELDEDLGAEVEQRASRDALARCRDRLVGEGVDLAAYHSEASAADVADLRRALGYDRWDVLGVSYGARLAQTLLRTAPQGVRAAVLDSAYPVAVDGVAEFPDRVAQAFDRLFAACDAEAACAASEPALRQRFDALVDQLDRAPVEVVADVHGEPTPALVDGTGLRDLVFLALYEPGLTRAVGRLVDELETGSTTVLRQLAGIAASQLEAVSLGMYVSVQCHEEVPFADRAALAEAVARHPHLADAVEGQLLDGPGAFETCELWGAGTAPPEEDQPVVSGVPTLVVGGQLDPVTPLAWGEQVAAGLGNARFVAYPGLGHGVGTAEGCPAEVTRGFLDNPQAFVADEEAGACAGAMAPARVAAPTAQVRLAEARFDAGGAEVTVRRPVGWEELQEGVVVRQHDLLDPTGLVTLAAPGVEAEALLAGLRFDAAPRSTGLRQLGGREWSLYEAEADGAPVDIGLVEEGDDAFLVALFSTLSERERLRSAVFEPALASLRA